MLDVDADRCQDGPVEGFRRRNVFYAQMHVIDQPASMKFHCRSP
jgi:hypothetical protein